MSEQPDQQPEMPTFETAFIVLKNENGSWSVMPDLTTPFVAERVTTRLEIQQACQYVTNAIHLQDVSSMVVNMLAQNSSEDSQRVSAAVRDALGKRKEG